MSDQRPSGPKRLTWPEIAAVYDKAHPPVDNTDAAIKDLREILLALGLSDAARPYSPHEVVQRDILPAIHQLRENADD